MIFWNGRSERIKGHIYTYLQPFIKFFDKTSNNIIHMSLKRFNFLLALTFFLTSPLTLGQFVIRRWDFSPHMQHKLGYTAWNFFNCEIFPKTFHIVNLSDLLSTRAWFFPYRFNNKFFNWRNDGLNDGCTNILRSCPCQGYVIHVSVTIISWSTFSSSIFLRIRFINLNGRKTKLCSLPQRCRNATFRESWW